MDQELITKKELLQETGISYGSLYRWKRKGLLPDQWFIHKATFTGQETFFPKEKTLERVRKIKELKDTLSLDEMAALFSQQWKPDQLSIQGAVERGVCSRATADLFLSLRSVSELLQFEDLFLLYALSNLVDSGMVSRDEMASALTLLEGADSLEGLELVILRKMGVSVSCLCRADGTFLAEKESRQIYRVELDRWFLSLKEILNGGTRRG